MLYFLMIIYKKLVLSCSSIMSGGNHSMRKEIKTIVYDENLNVEAYRFEGIVQSFPNHFHDYYVIGLIEKGERLLYCNSKKFLLKPGDVILFNPDDNHSCSQSDDGVLNYIAVNISKSTMKSIMEEVNAINYLPQFSDNIIYDDEIRTCFSSFHASVMNKSDNFEKEEKLILLISLLVHNYANCNENIYMKYNREVEKACAYLENCYNNHVTLDDICSYCLLSKSTLLRAFTKSKGITPYKYLQSVRISKAKDLLLNGVSPADTALETGFADQSHFTNTFTMFVGVSPASYSKIYKSVRENSDREK